jgi:hypothetical protein
MSLHALAGHMAAKGRGPDSMLVHMTPEEVQSLQVLALKGGGTLTINPETGLPEANFLKKMLPMIAGFALGPAGFGLMSAGMAGAAVGGITALSTGSLSRGLMAGLGAYGGASLGAGLTSAGQGAMAASDIAAQQAAGTFPTLAEGASQEAVANYANQVNALRDTALSKAGEAGLGAKLAAGAGQMASNPGMYARELMTGLAAISPMMADEGVQTTTKRPDTGMIRNYTFDPYGQTYTSAGNYPASEYKGMARGGIVALAAGGMTPEQAQKLIEEQYATIGRSGVGTGANQIDQAGLQGWTDALVRGDFKAEDLGSRFSTAVTDYMAQNPNDQYTQYVTQFRANQPAVQQAPAFTNFNASQINDYIANNNLDAAGITAATEQFNVDPNAVMNAQNAQEAVQQAPAFTNFFASQINDYIANNNLDAAGITAATEQFNVDPNAVMNAQNAQEAVQQAPAFTNFFASQINDYIANNNLDAAGITAATEQFNVDPNAVINAQNAQETVSNIYRNVLGRDPDPVGLQYWTDQVTSGQRTGQEMYAEFLKSAQSILGTAGAEEIFRSGVSLEDAVKPFAGYSSADKRNIADEWVRNTLGREVTDADRSQQWYKDATSASSMSTYDAAQDIFENFQNYARTAGQDPNLGLGLFQASQLNPLATIAEDTSDTIAEDTSATQNTTTTVSAPTDIAVAPDTALPVGVSGAGVTTINPNGTITTAPDIPGRPEGGFTGTGQVKDVYTQGGGSTGYVSKAPTSMAEFNERFNRQTGDSLDAYRYLMGKGEDGVAPKYPYKSGVEQIMRPYSEATLGIPVKKDAAGVELRENQKYLFDAATKRYVENPNYRPLSYNSKGERMVGLTPTEVIKGITPFKDGKDDAGLFDFVTQNRISEAQLAATLGIPLVEARARLRAAAKAKGITNLSNIYDGGGDGFDAAGNNTASNNAPVESMGTDTGFGGDGAGAGAPGGGNAAGGPGNSGDGLTGDSSTAGESNIKRGGLVPRRMALGGLGALAKGGVAELPDGAFVLPARITSELGNGSTNAGAQKLHAMEQRLLGKNAQPVNLGRYSGGGNLVRGAGDGVSDSVPATIGGRQPARIADGEYIFSQAATKKLGKGSTEAGARKLYAMMDRVQKARGKTTGKNRVAANTRADKYLPA